MKTTTLAPWFGSNRTLANTVGDALKGCRWVGVPFAGGMCELAHITAPTIVVNDLHRHIINLAGVVADNKAGPQLYRALRRVPFHSYAIERSQHWSRTHGETCPGDIPDIDAAYHYFVAVWMGRSAKAGTKNEFTGNLSVRWNANGGDSNTRYRSAVKSLIEWRRIMQRCNFVVMDCFDFLGKCNDEPENGIYCDPPFPNAGDVYKHEFTEGQHRTLASRLGRFQKAHIVCRFYDHPLIRKLYPEKKWKWQAGVSRKQSNKTVREFLLINRI